MDIGSIFLNLGILILAAIFISRPFLRRTTAQVGLKDRKLSPLLAEQERLLAALQELDFDHHLGKIPEADYPLQRDLLIKQAASTLRMIDSLRIEEPVDRTGTRNEHAMGNKQADSPGSANRVDKRPALIKAAPDDEVEAMIASRRRERSEKAAGFCPQCGKPIQISDRFCPRCGAVLMVEEAHQE